MKNKWKIAIIPLEIKQKTSKVTRIWDFPMVFLPVQGIFKAPDESLTLVAEIENESFRKVYLRLKELHVN